MSNSKHTLKVWEIGNMFLNYDGISYRLGNQYGYAEISKDAANLILREARLTILSKHERLDKLAKDFMEWIDEDDSSIIAGTAHQFHNNMDTEHEDYSGLWIGVEPGPHKDGIPVWNALGYDLPGSIYKESGTWDCIPKWEAFCEEHDVRHEFHDNGTLMIYFND